MMPPHVVGASITLHAQRRKIWDYCQMYAVLQYSLIDVPPVATAFRCHNRSDSFLIIA